MSNIGSGQLSSDERPIELRTRKDLVLDEAWYQSERSWIVKDPLALQYCRLREPEYCVFRMLNGRSSLRDIQRYLTRQFPERVTRLIDVQQLIASLNRQGLLVSTAPGQAGPLLERAGKIQRQKMTKLLSSALALRLPGVDPERFLSRLYPQLRWFFTGWCTTLCLLTCIAASMLILSNLDEFFRRLPAFHQFFALQNLLAMGAILIVTKTLHEFGHGLMTKHFGGECHEIGVMFLVLMPAMYCDTSDSWRLPNKWQRMAIGAAGMYLELVLAAICTFIWWYTNPGWLHYFCLNVMFLCSVSTILFNGNPLLRYDGYYILSDWLEVPNLAQKSRMALLSQLRVAFLGMEPLPERSLPSEHRTLFAIYSVLSVIYRWFVLIMILWFLSKMFEPWGLQTIGHFLIGLSLVGLIGVPLFKLVKFFSYPGRFRQVKRHRMLATMAALSGVLAVILLMPFTYYVDAHLVVRPADAQRVYVPMAGILGEPSVSPGQQVATNQLLASLRNSDEQVRLEKLRSAVAQLENEIARLNQLTRVSPLASTAIVSRQSELEGARMQLALQQQRLSGLDLRSNLAGIVIPPPNRLSPPTSLQGELATWSGTPFDTKNQGTLLTEGTWFCSVAPKDRWEAVLMVPQDQVKLVESGHAVHIMLDEFAGRWIAAHVDHVSQDKVEALPRELTQQAGGAMASEEQTTSGDKPLFDYYQVTARIDAGESGLAQGFRGRARVKVGKHTLAWRIRRLFKTVFNFS